MTIQGVLIECEDANNEDIYTNSGLLFADKFVIITGNVLMPYLKSNTNNLNIWLQNIQSQKLNFSPFATFSKKPQLKVVYKKQNQMKFKTADVIAVFVCKNILKSSSKYLQDWAIDFSDNQYQAKQFLSLFFILKITNNNVPDLNLNLALAELLQNANQIQMETGKEVFMESTPFGNRGFLNSYSQGVISNVTGENSCLLLTDCSSAPGSEGCPVFIKVKTKIRYPIGIVISSLNWWQGEWVGLTLCASLVPLLSQLMPFQPRLEVDLCFENEAHLHHNLLAACANSLVQVTSGSGWGTGILLDKDKGIFLTNSHVIKNDRNIMLHWKDKQIRTTLLYKTPDSVVYDIAIMQSDSNIISHLNMSEVRLSLKPAVVGEEVFAAGYPLFSRNLKPKPTLTKGYVSQTDRSMIKTTCAVLPGASGGAIFRPGGELIAVIVSNVRMENIGIVYPRINMTIPILAIHDIICEFLCSGDLGILQRLHSNDVDICKKWMQFSGKL